MEFNFDNASLPETKVSDKPAVLKPGIYNVVTEKLEAGLSDKNQSPYIDWTIKDPTINSVVTQRYFVSNKVNEGKKMSAWDVSSSAFLMLVMAATKTDKDTAKARLKEVMTNITDHNQLATKLSTLVIGKSFTIKINGKEILIESGDNAGKKFVRSEFGNYTFAEALGTIPSKLGKPYVKTINTENTVANTASTKVENTLW